MPIADLKPTGAATSAGLRLGEAMDRKIERPAWHKQRRLIVALAGAVLVALTAWLLAPPAGRTLKIDNAAVTIAEARRAPFEDFVPVRGRVVPLTTVYLDAIEGGRVERIHVEDGAGLAVGAPIVELSNTALQLTVITSEANITEQLNSLRNIELTLERDRLQHARDLVEIEYQITRLDRILERRKTLAKTGAVSDAELQNAADEHDYYLRKRAVVQDSQRTNARLQAMQMAQMREATAQLQKNLEFARKNVESLFVRAPIAGKLTAFNVEVGQSLAPGTRIGQIDDPTRYKVSADIDEFYLGRVDIGQTASVSVDGRDRALRVAKIYPQIRDGKFNVDLTFSDAPPDDVRRGQTVQLKLTLGDTTEALLIPDGAFYQDTGGQWLFVVSADGRQAARRTVRLGRRNARFIEVLDGLEPGERIVTSPYTGFLDKDRLQLASSSIASEGE
ncbi:MAG: efflux RND transporter periplasmic adaptor subunit [Rhodospirillaceae bacterium]|nr:efflux RND transporter periplasmic adaptor subunit [Rhodospirillaceae bacterium]